MDQFRVRTFAPGWMEVEHPMSGYAWSFSIDQTGDGRRVLSTPTGMGWGGSWPGGDLTQAAYEYARDKAIKTGRADG